MDPIKIDPVARRRAEVEAERLARQAAVAAQDRAAVDARIREGERRLREAGERRRREAEEARRSRLRAAFLATGGTEAEFAAEYPSLLKEWRRQEMLRRVRAEGGLDADDRAEDEDLRRRPEYGPY